MQQSGRGLDEEELTTGAEQADKVAVHKKSGHIGDLTLREVGFLHPTPGTILVQATTAAARHKLRPILSQVRATHAPSGIIDEIALCRTGRLTSILALLDISI